jgi:topoisomerase IA-like protein
MILAALDAGIPMSLVVEAGDISRQHCYSLIESAKSGKRSNGRKTASKSAKASTKTTTRKGSAKPKPTVRKPSGSKPRLRAKA